VEVYSGDLVDGRTALSWAAKFGHDAVLKVTLECESVAVNLTDVENRTPLSWAAGFGCLSVIRTLHAANGVR
jgi:ankyrin repeat protein